MRTVTRTREVTPSTVAWRGAGVGANWSESQLATFLQNVAHSRIDAEKHTGASLLQDVAQASLEREQQQLRWQQQ